MDEEYSEELLEPLKLYRYELSYRHQDNVEKYFDSLLGKSNVDAEANRATCKEYYAHLAELNKIKRSLNNQNSLRGFLIFVTVFTFIVGTLLIGLTAFNIITTYHAVWISLGVLLIATGIFAIVMNSTIIAKKIATFNNIAGELQRKADKKLNEAQEQMLPLNVLYDWGIPSKLMNQTTPLIHMDQVYGVDAYKYMVGNFKLKPDNGDNVSVVFVQSGTILGNPFIIERDYIQSMYQKTYVGSITISWTTTEVDSKGNTHLVTHTQTLTASITRPAACYGLDTALIYGNEAAPDLCFSRSPSGVNGMDEKQIDKYVKNFEKQLQKKQEKSVKSNFTALGNTKFEALFNALNRDNEVQFRLLFTPLAQKNMISLITSNAPYGDDFSFTKRRMINIIRSSHMQNIPIDGNPYHFRTFDIDKARENFISLNMKYFQGIFYDFAPLLSIPLYQQHKDYVKEYYKGYNGNNTPHEAETLANFFDDRLFMPEDCNTHIILKANHVTKVGKKGDIFDIAAYGFRKEPRVAYESRMGGDGYMHTIPIEWEEYIPVEKHTLFGMIEVGGDRFEYIAKKEQILQQLSANLLCNDIIYQRGLLSFLLKEDTNAFNAEELIKLFSHKED